MPNGLFSFIIHYSMIMTKVMTEVKQMKMFQKDSLISSIAALTDCRGNVRET